jgi:hypothetical protein
MTDTTASLADMSLLRNDAAISAIYAGGTSAVEAFNCTFGPRPAPTIAVVDFRAEDSATILVSGGNLYTSTFMATVDNLSTLTFTGLDMQSNTGTSAVCGTLCTDFTSGLLTTTCDVDGCL